MEHVERQYETQLIESDPSDENYRTISALAVVALITGLLSAVAFAHPLLLVLPLIAIGLAVAALWRIAQFRGELIGRKAALVGMAVAILFGSAAISYSLAREAWLIHRSRKAAEQFFSLLIAGKTHAAHQLTMLPISRLPVDSDLAGAYAENPEGNENFDQFLANDVIDRIRQCDTASPPQFQGGRLIDLESTAEYIELDYLLNEGGSQQQVRVLVEFSRHPNTRAEQWRLAQVRALE